MDQYGLLFFIIHSIEPESAWEPEHAETHNSHVLLHKKAYPFCETEQGQAESPAVPPYLIPLEFSHMLSHLFLTRTTSQILRPRSVPLALHGPYILLPTTGSQQPLLSLRACTMRFPL